MSFELAARMRHLHLHFVRTLLEEEQVRLEFPGTIADLQTRAAHLRGRRERVAMLSWASWDLKVQEHSGWFQLQVRRYHPGVFLYQNVYMFRGLITGQATDKSTLLVEGELRWKPFVRGVLCFWLLFIVACTLFAGLAFLMWGLGILFENDIRGPRFVVLIPAGLLIFVFGVVLVRLMAILDRGAKRLLLTKLGDLGFQLR